MKEIEDGGPAFPELRSGSFGQDSDGYTNGSFESVGGMSLRDWFAGKAMAGDLANSEGGVWDSDAGQKLLASRARFYYTMADAMLEARKAKGGSGE